MHGVIKGHGFDSQWIHKVAYNVTCCQLKTKMSLKYFKQEDKARLWPKQVL